MLQLNAYATLRAFITSTTIANQSPIERSKHTKIKQHSLQDNQQVKCNYHLCQVDCAFCLLLLLLSPAILFDKLVLRYDLRSN